MGKGQRKKKREVEKKGELEGFPEFAEAIRRKKTNTTSLCWTRRHVFANTKHPLISAYILPYFQLYTISLLQQKST